jgi:hypothetical protein
MIERRALSVPLSSVLRVPLTARVMVCLPEQRWLWDSEQVQFAMPEPCRGVGTFLTPALPS